MGVLEKEHPLQVLIKVLEKLKSTPEGVYLIFFSFSNFRPYNRLSHQINAYRFEIEKIFMRFKAKAFTTRNGDVVVLLREASFVDIEKYIGSVRNILPDDPFLLDRKSKSYYTCLSVRHEYNQCLSLLEDMLMEDQPNFQFSSLIPLKAFNHDPLTIDTHAIPVHKAIEIISLMKNSDLEGFIKRRSVVWIESSSQHTSIGQEFYISQEDLENHFELDRAFISNPWFFKHLTLSFDRKMIDYLFDILKKGNISCLTISLNARSVISSHFYRFLESLKNLNIRLIVELDRLDLISDYEAFDFARQILQEKDIEVCLSGIDYYSLRFLEFEQSGVNMVKLLWSKAYIEKQQPSEVTELVTKKIEHLLEKLGQNNVILARSDSQEAVDFGSNAGIKIFQGRHVEQFLKKTSVVG